MILCEITKALRQDDAHIEFSSVLDAMIYISQNTVADDGYRLIEFQPGNGGSLRENSVAVVRTYEASDATQQQTFNTIEEAQTFIDGLDDSDGYDLIDLEQPIGPAPSIINTHRPSLWSATSVASRQNAHGRNDGDRF